MNSLNMKEIKYACSLACPREQNLNWRQKHKKDRPWIFSPIGYGTKTGHSIWCFLFGKNTKLILRSQGKRSQFHHHPQPTAFPADPARLSAYVPSLCPGLSSGQAKRWELGWNTVSGSITCSWCSFKWIYLCDVELSKSCKATIYIYIGIIL